MRRLKHHCKRLKTFSTTPESLFRDQGVGGSNPLSPTNLLVNQRLADCENFSGVHRLRDRQVAHHYLSSTSRSRSSRTYKKGLHCFANYFTATSQQKNRRGLRRQSQAKLPHSLAHRFWGRRASERYWKHITNDRQPLGHCLDRL